MILGGSMVDSKRPDNQDVQRYLAIAVQPQNAPTRVVIRERWVLDDQVRGEVNRLAGCRYRAPVPGLYRGKSIVEEDILH